MSEIINRVVIFPRGQLTELDKARFAEAGILVAEADDPKAVVQLNVMAPMVLESTIVSGDAVLVSLLKAVAAERAETNGGSITSAGRVSHDFVRRLAAAIAPEVQGGAA